MNLLRVLLTLSWRNLWRNHRRTLVMLAAITTGVWAMIFMTALMRGMVDDMISDGIGNLPGHVQVHHPLFRDDPSIVNSFPRPEGRFLDTLNSPIVVAWTSRIRVPAVISSERDTRGVTLIGVDPESERRVSFEADQIIDGRFLNQPSDKGLVVGAKLLERLETKMGRRLVVMSQDPENNIVDRGFRIVGVYKAKLEALEETFVFTGREVLENMLGIPGKISEVAVLGRDYRDIESLYRTVAEAADSDLEALPWYELDTYLGTMLNVMDGFVLVWMVVVFLALSFGLANTLSMAVFERVREIGLIQALGMRPSAIITQILIESFFLLAIGLVIGNLLAILSIKPLEGGIDISVVAKGMEMMGSGSILYPALKLPDMVMANIVVIVLGFLTGLLPAWRASRFDPVEAINKT
ncbi:MAG: ABC transporter permease [Verrucomicrobia bacterium]|nr:MAG: ABC transporter permease [Verrucomicrobiota bacterium]